MHVIDPPEDYPPIYDGYMGPRFVDRCKTNIITEHHEIIDGREVASLVGVHEFTAGLSAMLFVEESVQEICAVLDDCADATDQAVTKQ